MIRKSDYPKIVHRPETLRIGDTIRVTHEKGADGIIIIHEGTIGARNHIGRNTVVTAIANGSSRGGVLFGYGPGIRTPRILLIAPAPELEQIALFNDKLN